MSEDAKIEMSIASVQNPEVFTKLAAQIQKHVKENNLTSSIRGKIYPHVEAWQFAGALIGIYPRMDSLDDLSVATNYKYRAKVTLIEMHSGRELGSGVAICTNKEGTKRSFDEYAIASMAQTRATGKAFRLMLGRVMKAAGFEPTPMEDMEPEQSGENSNDPKWYQVMEEYKRFAIKAVSYCENASHIHDLISTQTYLKTDKDFVDTARAQYKVLSDEIA